jgi:hypothetical protein
MSEMGNIEHSTFNAQRSIRVGGGNPWTFSVECSALNVLVYEIGGQA